MPSNYEAWNSHEHPEEFDNLRFVPTFALKGVYESFNDVQLLCEVAKHMATGFSVLEVGCATGEFSRYLSARYPRATYTGWDISPPAIERARSKFPKGPKFHLVDPDLNADEEIHADILFCRDVVHHQDDPFSLIKKLYELCTKSMVLRIRTRDVGETVLDPNLSCQSVYGKWVPFVVLNCDELLAELMRLNPRPGRIKLVKDYIILGGSNGRFLPKSCYEESTGTAETALVVEVGGDERIGCKIEQEVKKELSGHSLLGRITRKSLESLLRKSYAGSTWW